MSVLLSTPYASSLQILPSLLQLHSLNLPQGWATYVLTCQDGSYYVGSTNDLFQRILDHANGKGAPYTKDSPPKIFAWYESHPNAESARQRERQLKGWSRAKKHALLRASSSQYSFGLVPHLRLS